MKKLLIAILMLVVAGCATSSEDKFDFAITAKQVTMQYDAARAMAILKTERTPEAIVMIEKVDDVQAILKDFIDGHLSKIDPKELLKLEMKWYEARVAYLYFYENIDRASLTEYEASMLARYDMLVRSLDQQVVDMYNATSEDENGSRVLEMIRKLTRYMEMYALFIG